MSFVTSVIKKHLKHPLDPFDLFRTRSRKRGKKRARQTVVRLALLRKQSLLEHETAEEIQNLRQNVSGRNSNRHIRSRGSITG